jgi:hypothetical protein
VFSYRIEQEHSGYNIHIDDKHQGRLAYTGFVYVDRETHQALRVTTLAEGIPSDWPIIGSSEEIDYDFVSIDGKKFLVPVHAESRAMAKSGEAIRTVVDFSDYHKFSTGVVLTTINQ